MDLTQLGGLEDRTAEDILERIISGKDQALINRLDPRFAPLNVADRQLNQIYRTANLLFEETGTYDLFLGYPFVDGKFLDGTAVRCPVALFPVRLERNLRGKPRWKLRYLSDEPVLFNQTFFLAYEQFQQLRIDAAFWEEELDPNRDWQQWLNDLYERIKAYELEVNFNPRLFDQKLEAFRDMSKADLVNFHPGVLTFRSQAVLGIFPQSDSALLEDYKRISDHVDEFDVARWLGKEELPPKPTEHSYVKEEERFFTTELDQTQEEALLAVKGGQSLVLHGPPGTGKSQVIVNLIADAMAHGKRVLVVSQKRAALDVVHHRLQGLNLGRFSVLVHDYRHDRRSIYAQIKRQIDDLDAFKAELKDLNYTQQDHEFKQVSRRLDSWHRDFEALFQAQTQSQSFGLSAHELYLRLTPGLDPLPLEETAKKLNTESLASALVQLRSILDYRDLLATTHPWQGRLGFRTSGQSELQRLEALLDAWSQQADQLGQLYHSLSKKFNTRLLDPGLNRERMAEFREADKWLQNHQAREDMESLNQVGMTGEKALEVLVALEKALKAMDQRTYLDDGYWQFHAALVKHDKAYHTYQRNPLRWLNLDFLRAKWFWNKVLKARDLELDEDTFRQLRKEVKAFREVNKIYAKFHEEPFFESFPLLGSQQSKWEWWKHKHTHAEVYDRIRNISFYRKVKPRFDHGKLDSVGWQQSLASLAELEKFTDRWAGLLEDWRAWMQQEVVQQWSEWFKKNLQALEEQFANMRDSLSRDFYDLRDLDQVMAGLSPAEKMMRDALAGILPTVEEVDPFLEKVEQSVLYYWLEQTERHHPELLEVSSRGWPRKQQEYRDKVAQRRENLTQLIGHQIKERIVGIIQYNRLRNPITYREILHQVSKKRRLWSVRKLVSKTWKTGLSELVPCWMASPESASAIFPMQKDFFDLVIFDEASQCLVERALPIALRGKQCIIAGDDQQLKPFELYQVRYEDAEEELAENEKALEVTSILDLAKVTLPEIHLAWHYRSRHHSLIAFSNHRFYGGKLQVMPQAKFDSRYLPALEWISVDGHWKDNQNLAEAERTLDLVMDLVAQPDPPTMGIVTFNYKQQQLIGDLLDQRLESLAQSGDKCYDLLQAAMNRQEEEEWQGLFIKNIENVQGDERDVILFSVAYARDANGKLAARFGLLNQEGGENRLNVAITRARQKIYVLCSFLPHDLRVDESVHPGPRYFRDYLTYVYAASHRGESAAAMLLSGEPEASEWHDKGNQLADEVASTLESKGYRVARNLGSTNFRLDVAVMGENGEYLLGIEVEGGNYFSGETSKEREVYRPVLLQNLGWKLYRVWARNWWRNAEGELQHILKLLEA